MPSFPFLEGQSVYYEQYGDSQNPPLLMIHGLGAHSGIWKPQIGEFEKDFNLFVLDLPGHGQSGRLSSYSMETIVEVIKAFLRHTRIKRIHIIGISIGCSGALLFAARCPEKTQSLILAGPAGGTTAFSNPLSWLKFLQLTATIYGIFGLWALLGRRQAGWVINWIGRTDKYAQMLTAMEETVDPKALKEYAYANADAPYRKVLQDVAVPVLIICGLCDQFPRRYSRFIRDRVKGPCMWLEVPLAHHLVSLERPREFNLAAVAFLKRYAPFAPEQPAKLSETVF